VRRGDVRAGVPARRARRAARARPARAANAEPRRQRSRRRAAVLVEEPARVLPARGAALGAAGRGAIAVRGLVATRGRAREPDLVRRRRAAFVRVGADRLGRPGGGDHGDAGHRHRYAVGKGARGRNPAGMQVLTFGIQVADVAVDIETGEVRVERIAAIHDVGRVINPLGARSQVEGGIIQGVGHTLSEERLIDPRSGVILTQTLDTYKLPTIADVPELIVELLDIPDEHLTNLGSKGLGEPPIVPTAAAIV